MSRLISLVVFLAGVGLFAGIAVFAHVDFNEYHESDCYVDSVSSGSDGSMTLHYFFWNAGVEHIYQDQVINPSDAQQLHHGDVFKCVFYKNDKQFITLPQFYLDFWLLLLSIALMTLGVVIVISKLLGARSHFE